MLYYVVGFIVEELVEFEFDELQSDLEAVEDDFELDFDTPSIGNGLLSELAGMVPVMKALQLAIMTPDENGTAIQRRKLVEALEAFQRKPSGKKQDYALKEAENRCHLPEQSSLIVRPFRDLA